MRALFICVGLVALLIGLPGCKGQTNPGPMETIEDAEEWFEAAGYPLGDKTENTKVIFGKRAYNYKTDSGVHVLLLQFNKTEAATKWQEVMDQMPFGRVETVVKGKIGISLSEGSDENRQEILKKLKG